LFAKNEFGEPQKQKRKIFSLDRIAQPPSILATYLLYLSMPISSEVDNMLKTTLFAFALFLLAGCSTAKPGTSRQTAYAKTTTASASGSVQFIDNISVSPSGSTDKSGGAANSPASRGTEMRAARSASAARSGVGIEAYPALQFKFAILENASVEDLDNPKLLTFMDYWYGAPYCYGGMTRDGIDCSAFAFFLMSSVYGVASLPRTAKEQYGISRHIRRDELQEGDLVFFHTLGRRKAVTHVGVYLRNNKFIHASVSGVMISDLTEGYYEKHYVGAGRVLGQGSDESPAVTSAAH